MPAFCCSDDLLGIGYPGEWFGLLIVHFDERFDGGLQIDERMKHTVFYAPPGEFCKEPLNSIEPGTGRGCEVECPAWMALQPCPYFRMFVGGIIIENDVDELAGRHFPLDGIKKANELLVAMLLHVLADGRCRREH